MSYMRFLYFVAICLLLGASSCKDDNKLKSLSELKSEQGEAIRALIDKHGFKVVDLGSVGRLPEKPDPNVYYKIPSASGLYMRVLDVGDQSRRAVDRETKIFVSFKGYSFNKESSLIAKFDILSRPSYPPVEFLYTVFYQYGENHYTLLRQSASVVNYDDLMCQGLAYPMSLLGDGARVSLIIPFEIGPGASYASGYTYFIEEAEYAFSGAN
ncbi:MAG: DUF4827 family protein [Porphyromonadaceae bacterium]|nr:DUF4827 family protein [Porphyromonadaceae bacterium]